MARATRAKRGIRVDGDIAFVPLTKGQTAVVDACDADLGQFNWCAVANKRWFYAARHEGPRGNNRRIYLHQEVARRMGVAKEGFEVDHRDGNRLNCRRANLRVATHAENCRNTALRRDNTSGVRGVSWHRRDKRWSAQISINGKWNFLGEYRELADAKAAYASAAKKLHGDFAGYERGAA